ncbi:transglutaminase-like cysteine peptidase [Caulobacter endophyticus]|uniref:transglutaminase-like cysteine peptidase n=1 Tax=Caulobacter endophyticus TaxID=2172652 RepID=UPI0024106596|nr:transglutaminase-like cysteine peptidase [Caulobacter endophyticus]MDG2531892.1 transglutaminase-like cysteine peptidase [Caulobacter endophyticus]
MARKIPQRFAVGAGALFLGGVLLTAPAWAAPAGFAPAKSAIMPSYGQAPPPAGYLAFCERLPGQCAGPLTAPSAEEAQEAALKPQSPDSGGRFDWAMAFAASGRPAMPSPDAKAAPSGHAVKLTGGLWGRMQKINRTINRKIVPATDLEAFGASDYWALPITEGRAARGNCKHYVVEKREALIKAGIPAEALNIAVARTPWGEIHAVLLVETDAGDYVLDNLSPWVTLWHQTGYTWLQRQVDGQASQWAKVA